MTTIAAPPGSRAFLDHFPQAQRSTVMNDFLIAVRDGAPHVRAVMQGARAANDRRRRDARAYGPPEASEKADLYQRLLEEHVNDAYELALYALWRERLPRAERERLHAEGRAEGVRLLAGSEPPTERQLAYLQVLGDTGPGPTTLAEASERITRLREQRYGRA